LSEVTEVMRIHDLVIGLTGPNASGKGEVARLLVGRGFLYLSLSDVVREEARRRGLEPLRENLIRVGREMREEEGSGAVAERIRKSIRPPCVVDSVRNPGEVEVLRTVRGFRLLGVDASPELRFRRLRRRARPGDPETLEAFLAGEQIEDSDDPEGQRSSATQALADRILRNEGTLEELEAALEEILLAWGTEQVDALR
jgi:dephospho-CoA kinase